MKVKYQKPKITVTKVKMNTFWQNRSLDALETLHINQKSLFAASACGSIYISSCASCFPKRTQILQADGTTKSIEEITVNDTVNSFNEQTKSLIKSRVKELIIHKDSDSGYIIINGKLRVTEEHVMFINNNWAAAGTVRLRDILINESGNEEIVEKIELGGNEPQNMYNLELEGENHNFFAEGILVHNSKKGPPLIS